MKEIYLKEFWNLYMDNQKKKASDKLSGDELYSQGKKIVMDYQRKLEAEGWLFLLNEGGCVSPDKSTIFYSCRNPYVGQLWPWSDNPYEKEYQTLVKQMIETGDFIIV